MAILHQIIITFIKALFYGVLIIAGVLAGKKFRDHKEAKKAAQAGSENISSAKKEENNE